MTPSPGRVPVEPGAALRVALLGLGTVGAEVARGLIERGDQLAERAGGSRLELVAVGLRDPWRARGIDLPATVDRSDDLAAVVGRRDIDVVVELLGGLEPARSLVATALRAGLAVVTANKAVLARYGAALEEDARRERVALRFEAAVGGGIPVLAPLAADLAANTWRDVRGILNGTTNHILSAMAAGAGGYEEVLADAQRRGYAEADPTADVEGFDAADKLAILCRLAFGVWPDVTAIRRSPPRTDGDGRPGITGVSSEDLAAAAALGLSIKLVAHARSSDGALEASVLPTAVPASSSIGSAAGPRNVIELRGDPVGTLALAGPGAGGAATSSAVLGDLLALARGEASTWAGLPEASRPGSPGDGSDGKPAWFFRCVGGGHEMRTILGADLAESSGDGFLTRPQELARLRGALAGRGVRATLYPVLASDR